MSKVKSLLNNQLQTTKGRIILIVALLLVLYLIHAIYVWVNSESTDNAYVDGYISFVSPEVNGVIEQINFVENQMVSKGEMLVKIKDIDYKAKHNQSLSALEAGKVDIKVGDTKIQLAQLTLDNALKELNRTSKLAHDNFSSKKLLDDANLAFSSAQLELSLLQTKKQAEIIEVKKLEAILSAAKNDFDNTEIVAPFDGVITSSSARIGGYTRVGAPIFAIVPLDNIYVRANFKETQISHFKAGMHADITFDAIDGRSFKGKIRNLYPATGAKFSLIPTDSATGNFTKIVQRVPVIFDVEIPEEFKGKIGIGYSANINIRTDK